MTDNGKPTAKALAIAAIRRAQEEARRPDASALVLGALLEEARKATEQIQELVKPRKPRPSVTISPEAAAALREQSA